MYERGGGGRVHRLYEFVNTYLRERKEREREREGGERDGGGGGLHRVNE